MAFLGVVLVSLSAMSWLHGGYEVMATRDDIWFAEMALGVVLLPIGFLVLRRAHGDSDAWRPRFAGGAGVTALGSMGLAVLALDLIRNPRGQTFGMAIMGAGAVYYAVAAGIAALGQTRRAPLD